tara:strand:+ start:179 stop:475 length:297 start_codon:yes stop_codon:yes gene_type:complete
MYKILGFIVLVVVCNVVYFYIYDNIPKIPINYIILNGIQLSLGFAFWLFSSKKEGSLLDTLMGIYLVPLFLVGAYYGWSYLWAVATFIPRTIWNFFFG